MFGFFLTLLMRPFHFWSLVMICTLEYVWDLSPSQKEILSRPCTLGLFKWQSVFWYRVTVNACQISIRRRKEFGGGGVGESGCDYFSICWTGMGERGGGGGGECVRESGFSLSGYTQVTVEVFDISTTGAQCVIPGKHPALVPEMWR